MDQDVQHQIEVLKLEALKKERPAIYPFNPNFVDDFKGYTIGMTPEAIDKLHNYRSQGKFVRSSEEFQKLTGITDSLMNRISPYFRFPDWQADRPNYTVSGKRNVQPGPPAKLMDLNTATARDLMEIRGIGERLSARIVRFRNALGGFLVAEQLHDVYGLKPEVVERTLTKFNVLQLPEIDRINLNETGVEQLAALVYIDYSLASEIIDYRTLNGGFKSLDELSQIPGFPFSKIERIKLYLSL